MLNNPNAKSEDYIVQKGVAGYPVGFLFQFNGDGTPQVKVKIGNVVPRLNVDYEFSDDYSTLILIPTEEETKAPGFNYDDYLWMDKWVGMPLVIERDIPFVQESDYHLGRISPERIEKDFDLSVMRDQQIQITLDDHERRIVQAEDNIDEIGNTLEGHGSRIEALESGKVDVDQGKVNIGKVMTVNEYGEVVPKSSTVSGGIGAVAHDGSLDGAGTDEFPLSVKNKVTITIKDWE